MSEIKKEWYVLRAISGKENKVKETLEAEIKNTDLGDFVSPKPPSPNNTKTGALGSAKKRSKFASKA